MEKQNLEQEVNRLAKRNSSVSELVTQNLFNGNWQENLDKIDGCSIECLNKTSFKVAINNIKKILNQYEIIFNGTQDALFLVKMTERGTFKYIKNNDAYLEQFNLKREQMINKSPQDVFGKKIGTRFSNHYKKCILAEKVIVFEEKLELSGEKKVLLTKLTPILDEEAGKFIVGSRIDITARKEMEKKLDRMANYDKLTDIPNRRFFFKEFKNIIKKSRRGNKKFAVLFLDLDSFKEVNDKYGHEAGDVVLVYTAKRIKKCIREKDIVARIGGDEFALIINDVDNKEDIIHIVERIQAKIREEINLNEEMYNIDSSIGITIYPNDGGKIESLIKNADIAMYKVKNKNKGGYKFFKSIDLFSFKNKDGHVHTQYCLHGSDDSMERYIEEGILCGLSEISFTEHLTLPENFEDPSPLKDSSMNFNDLELYLNEAQGLKLKYSDKIQINVGVEVDYIEEYEQEIRNSLNRYGSFLDDSILSVHMIKGKKDKYYCIDFSVEEFQNIIDDLGSIEDVYNKYYDTLIMALNSNLGEYKPKRIGHFNLVRKFNKKFPYDYEKFIPKINEILNLIKKKGYELDFNVAGLRKDDCEELYIEGKVFELAVEKEIPMVLGSDSHSAKDMTLLKEFL